MINITNDFFPSFISGFGAKGEACRVIGFHNYLPIDKFSDSKCIYIEPFTFTGSVFFNIPCKSAILNDKNEYVFNLWNVLKNNYTEFEKELEFVFVGPSWFNEYRERTDPVGKAIFFYICNHLSYTGTILKTFLKNIFMCRNFRKDLLPWKEKLDNLTFYKFFNLDFHDFYDMLIKIKPSLERVNYVLYADPPYFVMGKCYKHSFKEQDHIDLANYHNQLKDRSDYHILISYDDHPEIRKLYSDWYVKEINYKTSVQAKKMEEYTELLISNKPIEKYKYNCKLDKWSNPNIISSRTMN